MSKFSDLINGQTPVLVDFYAEWCAPCTAMTPVMKEVKSSVGEKIIILKVDVDKNPRISSAFRIQGVPTFILFREGQIKWRQNGVVQKSHLEQVIRQYL
ncbi:thioredoxin [Olivibacter sp. SDN3]|uniref:thioredoxin n=1 Tax=Olivibacter sp. SDN3 TaxID=2764720 RepID=UPI0016517CA2|nr:thioredoxin [Olivibacter sp. SDN3]QNL48485.1 thioredoxin [Olivibacter sp. SDN3]